MKQKLNSSILFILLGFTSLGLKAQIKLNPEYPFDKKADRVANSFGLSNIFLDSTFSFNLKDLSPNKIVLPLDKLSPKYFSLSKNLELNRKVFGSDKIVFDSTFLANLRALGPNKIILPLDNMMCLLPAPGIKYHIQIFDTQSNGDSYIYNMPNALPKVDLVR